MSSPDTLSPERDRASLPTQEGKHLPRGRHFLRLLTGYYLSRDWLAAWAWLAVSVGMTFGGIQGALAMLDWQKLLFDAIGTRQYGQITQILLLFFRNGAWIVGAQVVTGYATQMLQIRWRAWLTEHYAGCYLHDTKAYEIEHEGLVDNPDQRIAEDLNLFTKAILQLVLGFCGFVYGTIVYTLVLYKQSEPLHLHVFGKQIVLPADFLIYTYGYAALSYIAIYLVGRPLIKRNMALQRVEADFRFMLTNVRRSAEQIAFYRAGVNEWHRLMAGFSRIKLAFIRLLNATAGVQFTQGILGATNDLIPIAAALPRYFVGSMTLGDVMQTRTAFSNVQGSLSWLVQAYPQIAEMTAIVNRIHLLDEALEKPRKPGIEWQRSTARPMAARDLRIDLPDGLPLLRVDDWTVQAGERWAIRGPSGIGKSTLLRAVAGLWPHGSGAVTLGDLDVMFVPQRLYMPDATLREILSFPSLATWSDADAREALRRVNLERLVCSLDQCRSWSQELSPGQQQLVGFARILLHRPTVLFMDEATSALDTDNAEAMYRLIGDELPHATVVSIIHNPGLAAFHTHRLDVADGRACVVAPTDQQND